MEHNITVDNTFNAMYLILFMVCVLAIYGNWQRG